MATANDPAGRLLELLTAVREHNPDEPIGAAWSAVFGLRWPAEYPRVAARLAEVVALPRQIQQRIHSLPDDDPDTLLKHLLGIQEALNQSQNINNPLRVQLEQLREEGLFGLEVCSSTLQRRRPERRVDDDAIARLGEMVEDLATEVVSADLDPDLAEFLLDQLASIRDALARVRIRGVEALEHVLDGAVGAFLRRSDLRQRLADKHPSMFKRVGSTLAQLAIMVTVAGGLAQLPGQVKDLLEIGQEPAPAVVVVDRGQPTGPHATSAPPVSAPASPGRP